MKEFPIIETAVIRVKAMVSSILYAVALIIPQLEAYSIDPFPVVEFMFAGLIAALYTAAFSQSALQMLPD